MQANTRTSSLKSVSETLERPLKSGLSIATENFSSELVARESRPYFGTDETVARFAAECEARKQLALDSPGLGFDGKLPRLRGYEQSHGDEEMPDLAALTADYCTWRDYDERMFLHWKNWSSMRPGAAPSGPQMAVSVKLAKRGNDYSQHRTEKRLNFTHHLYRKGRKDELWPVTQDVVDCSVVEVTLTCPASDHSVRHAWKKWIGPNYNRWLTILRQRYPGLEMIRTWESTEKGYPHVHVLLFLPEPLKAYKHLDQDLKWSWRLSTEDREQVRGHWGAIADVKAVRTLANIARYLVKHVLKGTESGDTDRGDLTRALLWLYRKRSFSLSRGFQRALSDLIRRVHNSKVMVLPKGEGKGNWSRGAFVPAEAYGWSSDVWCVRLEISPGKDPCPLPSKCSG